MTALLIIHIIQQNHDLAAMVIIDTIFAILFLTFLWMSDSYMRSAEHFESYKDIANFYIRTAKIFFFISAFFGIMFLICLWVILN